MNQSTGKDPGLWDLAVLSLLYERPMHPYEMQRVLRARHKDEVLGLKKGSLYHAIGRLERRRSIEARETEREGKRPERTVYAITETGKEELFGRLRSHISIPKQEPTDFMASVSFLVYMQPDDAATQLAARAERLRTEVETLGQTIAAVTPHAGRVNVLELEYTRAMQAAELEWVEAILDDLRSGQLNWDIEAILQALRERAKS